jgi:transglutaminase-like putative cysteine protease
VNVTRQIKPDEMPKQRRRLCSHNPYANIDTMNPTNNDSPFGDVIYTYTRAHAVADGFQVEVTTTAHEAGIRFPVFLTRSVYDAYVTVPPDVTGQDEAGRLWDIVWMLRFAVRKAQPGQPRLPFALYVRNDKRRPRLVKLIASCSALDVDDSQPAITVMMPDEN